MHRVQLGEILRDANISHAISPLVREYRLTEDQTRHALLELHVPRAANVAAITHVTFPMQLLLCNYQGSLWSQVAQLTS